MAGWVDSAIRYVGKEGGGVEVEFNDLTRQFEISVPAGLHVWHDDSISGEGTEDNPLSLAWDVTLPTIPEEPFEATDTLVAVSTDDIVKRISLTSVSTAILDEAAVATAAVVGDLSGVTDAATARDTLSVYSKAAVDSLLASTAAGSGHRVHVRAATTGNITIATALVAGETLDTSVTLVADDLVLVKDQSTASQNGVYVVGSTPARYPLLDGWEELPGALVTVGEGTTNHDTLWLCTSDTGGTIDTTNVVFTKLTIAGELLASNNLSELASAATARTNLGLGSAAVANLDNGAMAYTSLWSSATTYDTLLGLLFAQTVYTESGTSFDAGGTDSGSGRLVAFTSASAVTCTLDAIPAGQTARFAVLGTGTVTFTVSSGTLHVAGWAARSAKQGARVWAQRIDASTVHLWGDLVGTVTKEVIPITVGDDTTVITAGTTKAQFRMPAAFTVTDVRAHLITASSSGVVTVDVNGGGTSILSTKLTIDANELTSTTAATPAVISDASIADDAVVQIDIDGAGTNAAGLRVYLIGYWT